MLRGDVLLSQEVSEQAAMAVHNTSVTAAVQWHLKHAGAASDRKPLTREVATAARVVRPLRQQPLARVTLRVPLPSLAQTTAVVRLKKEGLSCPRAMKPMTAFGQGVLHASPGVPI